MMKNYLRLCLLIIALTSSNIVFGEEGAPPARKECQEFSELTTTSAAGSASVPKKEGVSTRQQKIAQWAEDAYRRQDKRFFNKTTHGIGEWLRFRVFGNGYGKCNRFVAAAYREGAGLDFPKMKDGNDPIVEELANASNYQEKLDYFRDPARLQPGDIVIWYDPNQEVHHTAIVVAIEDQTPIVTYAGAGEQIKRVPLDHATLKLKNVTPVFRRWRE
jgi:hypothetical protein